MLAKIAPLDPAARCCWECTHGNGNKPSKRKTLICDVDGSIVFRLVHCHCPAFSENERAAKQRRRQAATIARETAFPAR
jgi:hypothetical protein